jgi:hypothetical protein
MHSTSAETSRLALSSFADEDRCNQAICVLDGQAMKELSVTYIKPMVDALSLL